MSLDRVVVDSSVVIAVLNKEPGATELLERLSSAVISTVNLAEVATKLLRQGGQKEEAEETLSLLGLEVVPLSEEVAWRAGELVQKTKEKGLSLGDRVCLALAEQLSLPALTADRAWKELTLPVQVQLIR
jgi:ribonuclease VapC